MLGYSRRPLQMNVVARHLRRDTLAQPLLAQAEQEIRRAAPGVFIRAEHKCEFCGYHEDFEAIRQISLSSGASRMKSHLEIIPLDGDISNTAFENLGVACAFCAPVFSLNALPSGQTWHVAWVPHFEQSWISLLSVTSMYLDRMIKEHERVVDEGGFFGGPAMVQYGSTLKSLRVSLKNEFRSAITMAKNKLGIEGLHDFAIALERLGIECPVEFERRDRNLAGFVLIPDGLVAKSWAGFDSTLDAVTAGGSFAGLRSLLDLAALGRQSYIVAAAQGWPPQPEDQES